MSRVADAMARAVGRDSNRLLLTEDDHPWGEDLSDVVPGPEDLGGGARFQAPPAETTETLEPSVVDAARRSADMSRLTAKRTGTDADRPHLLALVERVFLPVSGAPAHLVAFSGLGTTSSAVSAAVAELLAERADASVCIVDANFSSPSLHYRFGVSNARGLATDLDTQVPLMDVTREVGPNLWLLPAGAAAAPSFAGERARLRLAEFVARFDYVLVDVEPLAGAPATDTAGLLPLLDGVILVLAADTTRRESARRTTRALHDVGVSVIGAVLTNRKFPIPEALYHRL